MWQEARVPTKVSDKGAWQLDENSILADAQEASGVKLTWKRLNRAERWQKTSLTAVFRLCDEWNWCIAEVLPAACESCGVDAGERTIVDPRTLEELWVCEACAHDVSPATGIHVD
jgi:hypothetical protein